MKRWQAGEEVVCCGFHCEDNTIDGIIDPRAQESRAPWWVHATTPPASRRFD